MTKRELKVKRKVEQLQIELAKLNVSTIVVAAMNNGGEIDNHCWSCVVEFDYAPHKHNHLIQLKSNINNLLREI